MAGPWLRFRGHLDNIANNTLTGAVNYFNEKTDSVKNLLTGEYGPVPATQRAYKAAGVPTIVVGDHNYGEGSSREHAAMQPRHLGIRAILVKSFARIHETNLKKQGMLAITFSNESDYELIQEEDTIDITDLTQFSPDRQLTLVLKHKDGSSHTIKVNHTYNAGQIQWFKAGSALNLMAKEIAAKEGFKQPMVNKKPAAGGNGQAAKATPKPGATSTKPMAKVVKPLTTTKVVKSTASKVQPTAKKVTKASPKKAAKKTKPAKKGLVKKALNKVVKLVKKVVAKKKSKAAPSKKSAVKKKKR